MGNRYGISILAEYQRVKTPLDALKVQDKSRSLQRAGQRERRRLTAAGGRSSLKVVAPATSRRRRPPKAEGSEKSRSIGRPSSLGPPVPQNNKELARR